MVDQPPLVLCMENINGDEVALKIDPHDDFRLFLDKSKSLLGFEVDLNSVTGNQPVSLDDNMYQFLLKSEHHMATATESTYDPVLDTNNNDDLVYILDDGTQIRASQIQFDNEDPLIDLSSEKIPFVQYNDDFTDDTLVDQENVSIKDVPLDSPVTRWSNQNSSPKSFVNNLPFKLVCNNTTNFETHFAKYLESIAKTYPNLNTASKNVSPLPLMKESYKTDEYQKKNDIFTREDVLNMFKDSPVTSLPYDKSINYDKRKHIRKSDPSRVINKNWFCKSDLGSNQNQECCICSRMVEDNLEKMYLFDNEDQRIHRCSPQKRMSMQLKIICEQCLAENFKLCIVKSPTESLNSDEYLVIKNNQQYIFKKATDVCLKKPEGVTAGVNMNTIEETNVKREEKECSSDVEIIEPEIEIDNVIDNLEDADDDVKEFLGKYQSADGRVQELKCRFCDQIFSDIDEVLNHGEEHKHDFDDGIVFPCPLCDYGYANVKWLKGHLKAAHDKPKDKVTDDKNEATEDPRSKRSSPVANGRSPIKNIHNDNDENDVKKEEQVNVVDIKTEPRIKFETEIKQEAIDSDDEAIWIVHTGDDVQEEQLHKLLNANTTKITREENSLTKHKCFTCSRIFPTSESLNTHKCTKRGRKRKSPSNEGSVFVPTKEDFLKRAQGRPRQCDRSGNNLLKVRKNKYRENTSQIVTCHNCNESFTSKVRLKFHMQFHDKTDLLTSEGYSCKECSVTLGTETELFDHVHFQHHKQKKWQCPVQDCGKMFFLRATLTKHSRTHTDTRRYVCVTCGKRFLDKQTLDEHGVTHLQIKPFQCHICLKQLTRRSRLRMHLRAHEEEVCMKLVYACGVCSRAFRDHTEAQDHAAKSTECVEEFTRSLKGERDEQLSPTSGVVRSSGNSRVPLSEGIPREAGAGDSAAAAMLAALGDTARAVVRVVRIEKAFRCEYCEDVFYLEYSLNSHRAKHKGVKNPFTCHICKVSFATYSRCTTHKTTHGFYKRNVTGNAATGAGAGTGTEAGSAGILGYGGFPVVKHFLCEDCGRSYLHWTYLQVHRRMKHANENFLFKCNQCELTFPNSWSVAYHRKKVHGKTAQEDGGTTKIARQDNYKIPCRDCDAVLPNKIALYKHRQHEHCDDAFEMEENDDWSGTVSKASTVCNRCGHNLHNVNALQKHLQEVHGLESDKNSRPKCPVCSRVFRSVSVRDEHMRVHTGERPFPCDVCGASFRRSTAMRNHRLLHSEVRAWSCTRCARRFRTRSDLRTHMRLKHPAYLAVIEIEGSNPTLEQIYQKLAANNISQRKVIEINMMTFYKGSTSIVPDSRLALSMLAGVPQTKIVCAKQNETQDMFQTHRMGIDKAAYTPATLQHTNQACSDLNVSYPTITTDGIQPVNLQVVLEDNSLVANQMLQFNNDIGLQ